MRFLFLFIVLSFAFPLRVVAQEDIFPTDIAGFRFGADIEEIRSLCPNGKLFEDEYICQDPGLNFDSTLVVHFSNRMVNGISIESPRLGELSEAHRLHGVMLRQLTEEFGEPIEQTETNDLRWSFGSGVVLLGIEILDFTHGFFELRFISTIEN